MSRREGEARRPAALRPPVTYPRPVSSTSSPDHATARREGQGIRLAGRSRPSPATHPGESFPTAEVEAAFAVTLERLGLRVEGRPVMDGVLRRVPVEGDRGRQRSGAYVGHLDGWPAGYARNHRTGAEERWRADATHSLRPNERAALARKAAAVAERRARARLEAQRSAARLATRMWEVARPAASHPYLAAKGVAAHGLRVDARGVLLVPVCGSDGRLWGLQRIRRDGTKLFLKDARTEGGHFLIGTLAPGRPLIVAEGYATGATLYEATGRPVAVAFNAHNLLAVASGYRALDRDRPIVVAGDDDHHLPRRRPPLPNVGRDAAHAVAAVVGGIAVIPCFAGDDSGTDWNDLARRSGLACVREAIEGAMKGFAG